MELPGKSIAKKSKRYAAEIGRAFCAQQHDATKGLWHGYPVSWKEVPTAVREALIARGDVDRRDIKRFWEGGA